MPDISMCLGGTLSVCRLCYRRTAKPGRMQSYFGTPPEKDGECQYYWEPEHIMSKDCWCKPEVTSYAKGEQHGARSK